MSFTDLTNTQHDFGGDVDDVLLGRTARAAELERWRRRSGVDDTSLELSAAGNATAGSFVQIEAEVIRVEAVENGGTRYQVTRGMHSSPAAAHAAQAPIYHAAEQDGDRGVSAELLRKPLQRELEPGGDAARRAGGERGVVRHESRAATVR